MEFNLKKILKALLFSTGEPLGIKDIQAVITRYHNEQGAAEKENSRVSTGEIADASEDADDAEGKQAVIEDIFAQVPTLLTATQIREAMSEIAAELEDSGDVCRLIQSSSGFKLSIAPTYSEWVRLLRNDPRPQRLRKAALETLAIIAYRQPVTRAEIEAIRGVNADSAIARLTEKELICISGRADLPGRPIQYATTQIFLDFAGINSLDELPASDVLSPSQITEWIRRASAPELGNEEMGLPSEEGSGEVLSQNEESLAEESEISETLGEPLLKVGDKSFPSEAFESPGSLEEHEDAPEDGRKEEI